VAHQVDFDNTVSQWAGGTTSTEVAGQTVQEALFQVAKLYPSFRLFNCAGELRSIVKVARNDAPAKLDEALDPGDTIKLSVGV
jgi:molybdopterin converting factor small subunit